MTSDLLIAAPEAKPSHCEKHGDFTSRRIFGSIWSGCTQCAEEKKAADSEAQKKAEADAALRRWERRLGQSGIPARFRDRTLDNYVAETHGQQRAKAWATQYVEGFDEVLKVGRCAILLGLPGTGKTHLACAVGVALMQKGHSALFLSVRRAIRRIKDTWRKDSDESETEAIEAIVWPDLLILDEVGVQFGSEAELVILFDVLNERYERKKPTILLSNLSLNDHEANGVVVPGIKTFLGERLMDRLREGKGQLIVFDWDSYRTRA